MRLFILLIMTFIFSFQTSYPCTIFTASRNSKVLAGNNEDFCSSHAVLHFFPPNDGKYGRVLWGIKGDENFQGGMNDQGLFFDGASTAELEMPPQSLPRYPGNFVMEGALENCATVGEVINYVRRYAMPFLRSCHILVADKYGDAVLIEWGKNQINYIRKNDDYLIATNFRHTQPELNDYPCLRYESAETILKESRDISIELFRSILAATHVEGEFSTIYSTIGDLACGDIYVYFFHNYVNEMKFNLKEEFKKGEHWYLIRSLFPALHAEKEFRRKHDCIDSYGIGAKRTITFEVIPDVLPSDSAQVYITGNSEKLGLWNPQLIQLQKHKNGNYVSIFSFHEGTFLEYKITRGSWDTEAVRKNGKVLANFVLDVKNDTTITIIVESWKDSIK